MDCKDLRDGQWTIYSAPLAGSFMLLLHSQELMWGSPPVQFPGGAYSSSEIDHEVLSPHPSQRSLICNHVIHGLTCNIWRALLTLSQSTGRPRVFDLNLNIKSLEQHKSESTATSVICWISAWWSANDNKGLSSVIQGPNCSWSQLLGQDTMDLSTGLPKCYL